MHNRSILEDFLNICLYVALHWRAKQVLIQELLLAKVYRPAMTTRRRTHRALCTILFEFFVQHAGQVLLFGTADQ